MPKFDNPTYNGRAVHQIERETESRRPGYKAKASDKRRKGQAAKQALKEVSEC